MLQLTGVTKRYADVLALDDPVYALRAASGGRRA